MGASVYLLLCYYTVNNTLMLFPSRFSLRTSETNYLNESFSFYSAIRMRGYYSKANKEDRWRHISITTTSDSEKAELLSGLLLVLGRPDLMVKKLRYYARFIVVCLLLKKMKLVRDLVRVRYASFKKLIHCKYIFIQLLCFCRSWRSRLTTTTWRINLSTSLSGLSFWARFELLLRWGPLKADLIDAYSLPLSCPPSSLSLHLLFRLRGSLSQIFCWSSASGGQQSDSARCWQHSHRPQPSPHQSQHAHPRKNLAQPPVTTGSAHCRKQQWTSMLNIKYLKNSFFNFFLFCAKVKFSELSVDMFRMLQTLEREPQEDINNQLMFDQSPAPGRQPVVRVGPPTSPQSNTALYTTLHNVCMCSCVLQEGMTGARENPHKYLLYKPTFSQLMTFLASGFKELPASGAMLLYLSADASFPSAKVQEDCACVWCIFFQMSYG